MKTNQHGIATWRPGYHWRIAIAIAFIGTFATARATDVVVRLSGQQEVPAVTTTAVGSGRLTIGADGSVSGTIHTKGIVGMMAHIHLAEPSKSGPAIIPLSKSTDNEWVVPPGSKLTAEQFAAFKAGNLYVNVHSEAHVTGEIRGQLKP